MSENNKVRETLPELGKDFFKAFEDASYEQWKAEAIRTLKGAPFEKKLLTKTYEGILLQPIYNADDISDLPSVDAAPGLMPYIRGNEPDGYNSSPWLVAQETTAGDPTECNRQLRTALERGATAVNLLLHDDLRSGLYRGDGTQGEGLALTYVGDLIDAFAGIDLRDQPVYLNCGVGGFSALAMLAALAEEEGGEPSCLSGCVGTDPLDVLAREGHLPVELTELYDQMAAAVIWAVEKTPELKCLPVHTHGYHDAGAHAADELACALATGVEYVREMAARGISPEDAASRIQWHVSVAEDFFMEMAKLRAARALWCQAMEAFGVSAQSAKLSIHARTSRRFMSNLDPHVNLLRATTSGFAAVLGGVDSLHIAPFDEATEGADDFSRRIAGNLQSVLKDECHLNRLVDPAGGSYYVEQLTDELAREAWSRFQEIERRGGMAESLGAGYPQEQIHATAAARLRDVHSRKAVKVGVNKYANAGDAIAATQGTDKTDYRQRLEGYKKTMRSVPPAAEYEALGAVSDPRTKERLATAIAAARAGASFDEIGSYPDSPEGLTVEPLRPMRTAEPYEELRRRSAENPPRVFLANLGPIPQHKARADFSRDFFSVGGFEVLTNDGFETPEAAAAAAIESQAPIAVICSTDGDYPESVPRFMKALGESEERIQVILAGYPKDQIEAHRQSGVDEFIHLRANNYQILENLLTLTGGAR